MSVEDLQDAVDRAVERAIGGGDVTLDEIERVLDDAQASIDEVRAYRGDGDE